MPRRYLAFCPGEYYHFYNRGVNRGKIFFEEENYFFFLRKVERYLLPILDVSAYCLMPTHYHLLVCVKEASKVDQTSEVSKTSEVSLIVSRAMMRMSVSYTKSINKRNRRAGPLFQGAFQAKHISQNDYLWTIIDYFHQNPVAAGLVQRPEDWKHSSCRIYLGLKEAGYIRKDLVME